MAATCEPTQSHLTFPRKGHGKLGGPYLSEKITGTHDWKHISIPLPMTPPKPEWLEDRIRFNFKGSGKVWLDDLEFREL
jgi:hypothetical protein